MTQEQSDEDQAWAMALDFLQEGIEEDYDAKIIQSASAYAFVLVNYSMEVKPKEFFEICLALAEDYDENYLAMRAKIIENKN